MAQKLVQLKRDPFARQTTVRICVGKGICTWCGADKRLYKYGIETDAGRIYWDRRHFCSVGCRRNYLE